jgi:transcriptional regulator of acetoin/glycerol metabolism
MIQRRTSRPGGPPAIGEIQIPAGGKRLEDVVAEAVALTLKLTGGNQAAAARILGISRPTLAKKMNRPAPFRSASVA